MQAVTVTIVHIIACGVTSSKSFRFAWNRTIKWLHMQWVWVTVSTIARMWHCFADPPPYHPLILMEDACEQSYTRPHSTPPKTEQSVKVFQVPRHAVRAYNASAYTHTSHIQAHSCMDEGPVSFQLRWPTSLPIHRHTVLYTCMYITCTEASKCPRQKQCTAH